MIADAERALGGEGGKQRTTKRLRYHVDQRRARSVAHEVYVAIPPGVDPDGFQPDRYLVAAAVRSDGVLAYHAALELLGAAHSDWGVCSVLTEKPRAPVVLSTVGIEFLPHPAALRRPHGQLLGVRTIDRLGRNLQVTGPERTLLDGFRHPDRVGGLEELVESAAGSGSSTSACSGACWRSTPRRDSGLRRVGSSNATASGSSCRTTTWPHSSRTGRPAPGISREAPEEGSFCRAGT